VGFSAHATNVVSVFVVATDDFEVYHEVVNELRDRGVQFTTVEPGDELPEGIDLVLTGPEDALDLDAEVGVVRAQPGDPRRAVEEALAVLRGGEGRTVVGVDPGERPGIAVLHGDVVVAVFQAPRERAVGIIRREAAGAPDPLVRVGDGARLDGSRIVNDLAEFRVELVDETGTTPYLGEGVRESADIVAAVNIARLEGEVVATRDVEPTAGELQVIKDRSREAADGNRAIGEGLARKVATGQLTLEEALDRHHSEGRDGTDDAA
jgi:hypothetical protein